MKRMLLLVVVGSLICSGCNRQPAVKAPAPAINSAQASKDKSATSDDKHVVNPSPPLTNNLQGRDIFFQGDFESSKALKAMFGNFDPQTPINCEHCSQGASKWSPRDLCTKESLLPSATYMEQGESFIDNFVESLKDRSNSNLAEAYAVMKFNIKQDSYAYFVIETQTTICGACSPLMSVTQWEERKNEWHLKNSSLCFAPMGGAGGFDGPVKLEKIGDESYGLMFHQDFNDWGHTLVANVNSKNDWQIIFNKITDDGNTEGPASCQEGESPGSDCWKYTSKLLFDEGHDHAHYDLIQKISGSIEKGDKVVPYNRTYKYRYLNERYSDEKAFHN